MKKLGIGSMLGCGAATKLGPACSTWRSCDFAVSISMSSLLPVLLLSPSSAMELVLACDGGGRGFLCAADNDAARLIDGRFEECWSGYVPAAFAGFLCASHLSTESARPDLGDGVFPCRDSREEEQLLPDGENAGLLAGLILRASHLSPESARPAGFFGGDLGRMATRGGGVSRGIIIFHLGGVGSNAGRAACAMARCTRPRANVTAMARSLLGRSTMGRGD
ncbi:hypothetical protein U9M48_034931 [Paspalum notatum var. saurae]|uniref:Uncharacterized protein n=1 Tax=Paspalum notatum var. saurae TaxID=547442 RepID=A0AAQ3X7U1_PASNO